MVDNIEVHRATGRFYDKKSDNILNFKIGPSHNRELIERVVEQYKENVEIEVLEYRIDTIDRGETQRYDERIDEEL